MKWSVSNIEIYLAPTCVRDWLGWAPPSVGAIELNGRAQYDMVDSGAPGPLGEGAHPDNEFTGWDGEVCEGSLIVGRVTGLQVALDICVTAALNDTATHSSQVNGVFGSNISLVGNFEAGYFFDGIDNKFYTSATVVLTFRQGPSPFADGDTYVLINDSQFDTTLSIPDPGDVWWLLDADGVTVTYSHATVGTGAVASIGHSFGFQVSGTEEILGGPSYPLAIAQFFDCAGLFTGGWTPVEAYAELGV